MQIWKKEKRCDIFLILEEEWEEAQFETDLVPRGDRGEAAERRAQR